MLKIGVVLSGCGFLDGAEINEAVCTLLAIDRQGAKSVAFAPDAPQADVVDHTNGDPTKKSAAGPARNMMMEAARIVRGEISPTANLNVNDLDALVFPGGFGAAKNLCNFAAAGPECTIRPEIAQAIRDAHKLQKPIGAICIAPALVAAAFRGTAVHPTLTIGDDAGTAASLEKMGARHVNCSISECVVDELHKIVSTPAYMYRARISQAAQGIDRLITEVIRLAKARG